MEADLRGVGAEGEEAVGEGLGSDEKQSGECEHPTGGGEVRGVIEADLGVRSVEADDDRQVADFQQREQMHADVTEIDVEHLRAMVMERGEETVGFAAVDGDGAVQQRLLDKAAELMGARLGQDDDGIERKLGCVLALLAENDGSKRAECRDLPIYVQHLGFKKSDHILHCDRRFGSAQVSIHEKGCAESSLDPRCYDLMFPTSMRREVEILNALGLHARPASEFVRAVQKFASEVVIHRGEDTFSAGSILEVLMANLDFGTRMTIEAVGPDAEAALDRLSELLVEFRDQEERERPAATN